MKCSECLQLLHERLDGAAIDLPALEQHLRECASCRELHRAGVMLADAAREQPRPSPSANLSGRITNAVLADRRARALRSRIVTAAALAACALIAITAYINWPASVDAPQQAHGPKQRPQKDVVPQKDEHKPSLEESVAEVSVAMTSLTERLADRTREHAEILWQATAPVDFNAMNLAAAEDMTDPLAPATEPLRKAGRGVSQGIETVSRSAQRAVDFFFRELGTDGETKN